jgi:hypothetical protein
MSGVPAVSVLPKLVQPGAGVNAPGRLGTLKRWRRLPHVNPERFRSDIDAFMDPDV